MSFATAKAIHRASPTGKMSCSALLTRALVALWPITVTAQPLEVRLRDVGKPAPPVAAMGAASAERIAQRVFDARIGGVHVGRQFVRMPGGQMFQRAPSPGPFEDIEREFFRFAIQIKLAERQIWLKNAHLRRAMARQGIIETPPKPLASFFYDDTLNAGDVVVAAEGFRVFTGSSSFPYTAGDFVTLERWRGDSGRLRQGLRDMERVSRPGQN